MTALRSAQTVLDPPDFRRAINLTLRKPQYARVASVLAAYLARRQGVPPPPPRVIHVPDVPTPAVLIDRNMPLSAERRAALAPMAAALRAYLEIRQQTEEAQRAQLHKAFATAASGHLQGLRQKK